MLSQARQKIWNSKQYVINCSINNNFSHHYKIKTHFDEKSTKNTFPGKKTTPLKNSTKNHFCFLKTLAGRAEIQISPNVD